MQEKVQGINSEILTWARETAGMSMIEAAKNLNIKNIERLSSLENGSDNPTRSILAKMAKCYRRPLLTFYLAKPPQKGNRGQDFRTLPLSYCEKDDALLDALVRDVKSRQHLVRAVLEEEEVEKIPFIASTNIQDTQIDDLVKIIQNTLKIDIDEYRKQPNNNAAFSLLRSKVEDNGIFVLLLGDLGSHHSSIPLTIFRGFADADSIAPFVVINDKDNAPAWSFTLLHELTHLWLGESGVSTDYGKTKTEKFCNEVAARILLPIQDLQSLEINRYTEFSKVKNIVTEFASQTRLNRTMVAYRLLINNKINHSLYNDLTEAFEKEREATLAKEKERKKGKPNWYTVRRHRLGKALIDFVGFAMSEGILTPTKGARILGIKTSSLQNLVYPEVDHRGTN
jgi:Zn-dependent peptidase ImmA (M78 family)